MFDHANIRASKVRKQQNDNGGCYVPGSVW
jgi:hypothetical protein